MMLLVLSLMVSLAHSHINYNQIAVGSHQASDPSSYYNNQPIRKPMYHYYPMTFFSQSPYSYQTTNKPYYATPSSPSAVAQSPINNPPRITPFWYRQPAASKHFHHPGINFEDEFFGPPPSSSVAQDRSLYNPELISPVVPPVEPLIQQVENLEPVMEVTDSTHLIENDEASGDGIIQSTIDVTVEVSTESDIQDATTSSLDNEGLSPRSTTSVIEDVTITSEETITEIEDESTTVLNDITTISETNESPIIAERLQSIIPFYLKPSTWRS